MRAFFTVKSSHNPTTSFISYKPYKAHYINVIAGLTNIAYKQLKELLNFVNKNFVSLSKILKTFQKLEIFQENLKALEFISNLKQICLYESYCLEKMEGVFLLYFLMYKNTIYIK